MMFSNVLPKQFEWIWKANLLDLRAQDQTLDITIVTMVACGNIL